MNISAPSGDITKIISESKINFFHIQCLLCTSDFTQRCGKINSNLLYTRDNSLWHFITASLSDQIFCQEQTDWLVYQVRLTCNMNLAVATCWVGKGILTGVFKYAESKIGHYFWLILWLQGVLAPCLSYKTTDCQESEAKRFSRT